MAPVMILLIVLSGGLIGFLLRPGGGRWRPGRWLREADHRHFETIRSEAELAAQLAATEQFAGVDAQLAQLVGVLIGVDLVG
ncbi:hypothetical protein GCM10011492_27700 [Flexivirga endophytica]|uniref:Uncharacterized protein n=1 Tax=Flexivirga endophytica TaxID=1849103 RepID=A0A916T8A6_9MICO|nr:hypothetical protein GCM10011492_27700 [Flexivirga endophytica]GHB43233.1 hypothetical protein GCM10008112_10080 [Flexivirga endophytica]